MVLPAEFHHIQLFYILAVIVEKVDELFNSFELGSKNKGGLRKLISLEWVMVR